MRLVKAILICPFDRVVKAVKHDADDYREIYKLLSHEKHPVDCFTAVSLNNSDAIFVDDNGLLNNPTHFFVWQTYPQPLAGRGLVLGTNAEGETVSTTLTVDYVTRHVQFLDNIRVAGIDHSEQQVGDVTYISSVPRFKPADDEE